MSEECSTCRSFRGPAPGLADIHDRRTLVGVCKRFPPHPTDGQPRVRPEDYCSEYDSSAAAEVTGEEIAAVVLAVQAVIDARKEDVFHHVLTPAERKPLISFLEKMEL